MWMAQVVGCILNWGLIDPEKEAIWRFRNAVVDLALVRERCTKWFALTARKNVKYLSSLAETGRYTAKNVSQSARMQVVKGKT